MLSSCRKKNRYCLLAAIVLSLPLFVVEVQSKTKLAEVEAVRVADFVNYTHIAIELSQKSGKVDFLTNSVGDYSLLIVKLHNAAPGALPSDYPVESDVLLSKISVKKYSTHLQLTIPCRRQVDLKGLVYHIWDDMVTIDLPLRTPNHNRIPSTEEIKKFCDPDGNDGRVVILDAGHGGFDSGAVPRYAKKPMLLEKDVALDLAKRMERMFKQHPKIKVFLTRYGDYLPVPFGLKGSTRREYKNESLRYRVQLAKECLGDVYLSLHLNAPPSRYRSAHQRARGYEIYYLGERHAENLMNNPDVVELTNLGVEEKKPDDQHSGLFLELLKENIPQASLELAGHITTEMRRIPWLEMRDPAMKSNRFTVIKQLLMPSVLVEFMFITNPTEHEQIRSSSNRTLLAGSVYKSVCRFLFDPSAPIQLAAADLKSIEKPAPKAVKASPPPPKKTTAAPPARHTVKRNESLGSIAAKYGVSVAQLRRLNSSKIKRGDLIYPGDVLVISGGASSAPAKSVDIYTVRRGDYLDKIARRFRTTVTALKSLNHFRGSNPTIHPGDKIKVPVTGKYSVAAAQAVHYTVKTGDSLGSIAESYGTTVSRLKRLNGYKARNPLIRPGDKIRIR